MSDTITPLWFASVDGADPLPALTIDPDAGTATTYKPDGTVEETHPLTDDERAMYLPQQVPTPQPQPVVISPDQLTQLQTAVAAVPEGPTQTALSAVVAALTPAGGQ